jgi:molybdenum cofactor biosynthesis enzyme MoaA
MRFHTLSVVVGGLACNARCPFCIASMTPASGLTLRATPPDLEAMDGAFRLARESGVTQVMLTGKGEPTLWPDHITAILGGLAPFSFPRVDLQTNGIAIADGRVTDQRLTRWRQLGLSLVAISVVHREPEPNRAVYLPYRSSYIDLPALIERLRGHDFRVRLSVVLADGLVDDEDDVAAMIAFAHAHDVEQLTLRPVNAPADSRSPQVAAWVADRALPAAREKRIADALATHPIVERLPWGGIVRDVDGLSVCLTNSLTRDDPMHHAGRQLIAYPDGSVSTSWETPAVPLRTLVAA